MVRAASSVGVGKETLAYCTSCKMDLGHIIAAMTGDRIVRAQCKTCKKEHAYKAPKGVTEPGATGTATGEKEKTKKARAKKSEAADEALPIEAEWEKLMSAHRDLPVKAYGTKSHFQLGDKIAHPTFGDGIVNKLIYPNKIEVIFRMDMKVLIHAGA